MTRPIAAASAIFTDIYMQDLWGLARMQPIEDRLDAYAQLIDSLLTARGITSVLECGCGFWTCQQRINWTGRTYAGFDVVPLIVDKNTEKHAAPNIAFHLLSDETTLPRAELLICKDVLQHLPNEDITELLPRFKQAAPLLLIINDIEPPENTNGRIERGGYRALDLARPPFSEACTTLHEWRSLDFGVKCLKRAALLQGHAEGAR